MVKKKKELDPVVRIQLENMQDHIEQIRVVVNSQLDELSKSLSDKYGVVSVRQQQIENKQSAEDKWKNSPLNTTHLIEGRFTQINTPQAKTMFYDLYISVFKGSMWIDSGFNQQEQDCTISVNFGEGTIAVLGVREDGEGTFEIMAKTPYDSMEDFIEALTDNSMSLTLKKDEDTGKTD